jgi:hypothetical protein
VKETERKRERESWNVSEKDFVFERKWMRDRGKDKVNERERGVKQRMRKILCMKEIERERKRESVCERERGNKRVKNT